MLRSAHLYFLFGVLLLCIASQAQYHGNDIPSFLGLQSGTQAPCGLYIGNVVWVYPTDTVKDANGNTDGQQRGHLTSTVEMILVELITNHKFLGANIAFQAAVLWIKNKIQFNSLDTAILVVPVWIVFGLLMRFTFVGALSRAAEGTIAKYVPDYAKYKSMAEEKLEHKVRAFISPAR